MLLPAAIGDYTDFYASSTMRPTSAGCCAPTIRCCRTTSGCRSAITAARRPCRQRHPGPAPVGPAEGRRRRRAGVRAQPAARLRARARRLRRPRQRPRHARSRSRDRRSPLRLVPAQRLVRARHPGVGVPAARPVPREELRHHALALGRDLRRAGAVPGRAGARGRRATPPPLPYLTGRRMPRAAASTSSLEVLLSTARMRGGRAAASALGASNLQDLYWTLAQMVAHHASNGCNLRPGDLLASGTVSGP